MSTIDAGVDATMPRLALAVPCQDTLESIYGDPGPLPGERGAIIRCAQDTELDSRVLEERATRVGYTTRKLTTGARVYRIVYRTERGTQPRIPGYASAIVYLPHEPRASRLPVLVANHGGRGQGPACAPSKNEGAAAAIQVDFERLVFPLVGQGFAVIAPDLAGYANYGAPGNPPPAFASSDDAGRSALDGARALQRLVASGLSDQIVLVGHSLGGHTSLSALALAETYGADVNIAAVATFAPLWVAMRTWGAVIGAADAFPFADYASLNAVSIWYHYTHAELLDGPGKGSELFAPEKREQVRRFVETACWYHWDPLFAMGSRITDVLDPVFANAVGRRALGAEEACPGDGAERHLCETWMARYAADRPHLSGRAVTVPQLLVWGGLDDTISYDRITCGLDRLTSDQVNLETICVDPAADHVDIPARRADYVADWIAAKVLGGPGPTPCPTDATGIVDPGGRPALCNTLPPND